MTRDSTALCMHCYTLNITVTAYSHSLHATCVCVIVFCRPLALMDNIVAKCLPGISSTCVPEELSQAGIGPLEYAAMSRNPTLVKELLNLIAKSTTL
jgi:hypothetical protein